MDAIPPSLWASDAGLGDRLRDPLDRDLDVDIAVIGAGFTGLWTAYHLAKLEPWLSIVVLERAFAGFGASGRNGGWCSALFPVGDDRIDRVGGPGAAQRMRSELRAEIEAIVAFCVDRGVDAVRSGTLVVARNELQQGRLRGKTGQWLDESALRARILVADAMGAAYDPDCAVVHPGHLIRVLAEAVAAQGVSLVEGTAVHSYRAGVVQTERHTVHARTVLRATEAWTPGLAGHRRDVAPVYSLIVATEPLPQAVWDEIGWAGRETLSDGRRLIVYAQRTADDRIVFGGRGAPYHWRSRIRPAYDQSPEVFGALEGALHELFPATTPYAITHRWGGPLGVPRDFFPSIHFDPVTRVGSAGGYVGDGVTASALAGRTLADLVTGRDTEQTRLAWVGHRSPRWEPEPLRWIGINAARTLAASVDQAEHRGSNARLRTAALNRLTGG